VTKAVQQTRNMRGQGRADASCLQMPCTRKAQKLVSTRQPAMCPAPGTAADGQGGASPGAARMPRACRCLAHGATKLGQHPGSPLGAPAQDTAKGGHGPRMLCEQMTCPERHRE
jgi:hypothetical protein